MKMKNKIFNNIEDQCDIIKLFNDGYSYDFISDKYKCSKDDLIKFKYKQKKAGIEIKDVPKNGGIGKIKKIRTPFVKLFSDPVNVKNAIAYINMGYTFKNISQLLRCDRTTILAFYRKKVKEGIIQPRGNTKELKQIKRYECDENINPGKSYKDYLNPVLKKENKEKEKRMLAAQETLKKLHEERAKRGEDCYVDFYEDYYS